MMAAIYVSRIGLTLAVGVHTRMQLMVAILLQCLYNARWCSMSHNGKYALGGNVGMAAIGLWQVACTIHIVLSKSNCWLRILMQVTSAHFLVFKSGRGFHYNLLVTCKLSRAQN